MDNRTYTRERIDDLIERILNAPEDRISLEDQHEYSVYVPKCVIGFAEVVATKECDFVEVKTAKGKSTHPSNGYVVIGVRDIRGSFLVSENPFYQVPLGKLYMERLENHIREINEADDPI